MNGPAFVAGLGEISSPDSSRIAKGCTPEQKIQWFVELAIMRCGTAAALARNLNVTAASVSEWRIGRKRPAALNLIRIQELAADGIEGGANASVHR